MDYLLFPDKNWNWEYLSTIKSLNMKTLEKLQDKPWDWNVLLQNTKFHFLSIDLLYLLVIQFDI